MLRYSFGLASLLAQVESLCYYPDGNTVASKDSPCLNNGNSTCCGHGYACLSDRLCELTQYVPSGPGQSQFVRGSCTDRSWHDPNCPSFCVSPFHGDNLSGAMGLQKCTDTTLDEYYCIDKATQSLIAESICQDNNAITFSGTPTTITVIGITRTTSSSSTASDDLPASFTPIQGSQSSSSSSSSTSTLSAIPSSIVSKGSDSSDHNVALGAGIGVPLGVIAIVVIALIAWKLGQSSRPNTSTLVDSSQIPLQALKHTNDDRVQSIVPLAKLWTRSRIGPPTNQNRGGGNDEGRYRALSLQPNGPSELSAAEKDPAELPGSNV